MTISLPDGTPVLVTADRRGADRARKRRARLRALKNGWYGAPELLPKAKP